MVLLFFLLSLTPFSADKVEIIKESGESIVHLIGNVKIEDESTKITCAEADLHETHNYVILYEDVKIVDKNGEINSDYAVYNFAKEKGNLRGNVSLFTSDEIISADSLYYDGMNDLVQMFKNVKIEDKENNLVAYGGSGWYNLKEEEGFLVDDPKLEILREDKEPIKIRAQSFQLVNRNNTFYGYDSVIALIDSINVYCDTFLYNLKTESGSLVNPIIVEENNELKGETGEFKMKDKDIESFSVRNGWSRYYTKEGSRNVVEGEDINIVFQEGKATKIIVNGQPEGVLYLKRGEEGAGD